MSASHWRLRAREVITDALQGVDVSDLNACKKAIDDAYPFGPREHWPYRMWLLERRAALAVIDGSALRLPECPACGVAAGKPCRDINTGAGREPHVSRGVQMCLLCGAIEGEACRGENAGLCAPGARRD